MLTFPPVLKQVNGTLPLTTRTEASGYVINAVLSQGNGKHKHPDEYINHPYMSAECNYSTTRQEALDII